jgi:hypothetical protein
MPLLGRQNCKKMVTDRRARTMRFLNRRRDFSRCSKLRSKRQNQTMAGLICQPRSLPVQIGSPFKDAENGKGYR